MLRPRIIPCLLIKENGLVKTVNFSDPKYVGDPINAVKIFNEKSADELIVLDIDASTLGHEPNYQMIKKFASESRMPLCYGGGIKTAEQAKKIIGIGVEKVALSSAAIENPDLVPQVIDAIGSASVSIVLDVKQTSRWGKNKSVWTHNGTKNTKASPKELAQHFESLGVGEIILNSIDYDGLMKGYDIPAIEEVYQSINIPLTVMGGAGSLDDIGNLFKHFGIIGAAAGSLFVFKGPYRAVLINYPTYDERDLLIEKSLKKVENS
jgi:imidazole glycerol-phosphate synthase subunit HisF